ILGPTAPHFIDNTVKVCRVVSAQQMYEAAQEAFAHTDIAILAAAVADYKPMEQAPQKIKKKTDQLTLELTKTQDILASLGAQKDKQLLIGFALETENELENAKGKLTRKHLDAIVLNSLNDKGAGFSVDTNQVTFITREDKVVPIPLKTKTEIAADILTLIHDELL
ncbi:MAG: phosphopantothenoylcysteine decarboxylase, partial [Capnocytophaga granulosa]